MNSNIRKFTLYISIIFALSLFLTIDILTNDERSLKSIVFSLYQTSFIPHHNIIHYLKLDKVPLPVYVYYFACISVATLIFLNITLFKRFESLKTNNPIRTILLTTIFTFYVIVTSFQTVSTMKTWKVLGKYLNMNDEQQKVRNTPVHKSYALAQLCHKLLPTPRKATLLTDLDLSKNAGMIRQRSLAFYLYPIDIRNIREGEPDTLIAFEKNNAKEFIPPNYRLVGQLDEKNLIAIKKQ